MRATKSSALATLLLCVFTLQEVVGNAVASDLAASGVAGYGAFSVPFEAYDDLGRATRATRRNAGGDVVTTERDFDAQGRVVRDALQVGGEPALQVTSNWAAAATGWNRPLAYPTGAVWTRSNDQIGRLVGLAGPQGNDIALNWQGEFYAGRSHTRGGAPALDELATLDGLGRRIGWDFTAGSLHAYKAEAVRDVVGRVASLTWGFGPSAAGHGCGYGYDPATRLADAWSWDGLAPGPDCRRWSTTRSGRGRWPRSHPASWARCTRRSPAQPTAATC